MDGILTAVLVMGSVVALVMALSPSPPKRRW